MVQGQIGFPVEALRGEIVHPSWDQKGVAGSALFLMGPTMLGGFIHSEDFSLALMF